MSKGLHRMQFEVTDQEKKYIDDFLRAAGATKRVLFTDSFAFLREHVLRCQKGYRRLYVKDGDPSIMIQPESKYDQLKLPF